MHFHDQDVDTNNQSHMIIMYTAEKTNHNHNSHESPKNVAKRFFIYTSLLFCGLF